MQLYDLEKFQRERRVEDKYIPWSEKFLHPNYITIDAEANSPRVIVNDSTASADIDYRLLPEIFEATKRLEEKFDQHDKQTIDDHANLESKLDQALVENKYFRECLSKVNTPIRLQRNSLLSGVFAVVSYFISVNYSVDIVHPYLVAAILFSSIIFYIMSVIMLRQDNVS